MPATSSDQPLISVVMPVYNAESFVSAAMESILHQTYSCFELIVVDDGSVDHTWNIIETLAAHDLRVRPLAAKHEGQAAALNAGIAAARGDYIALMDADDLALPERLAVQLDFLQRTGADICGACAQAFGAESKVLWFPESHAAICSEMLFRCALLHPTVLMRADVPHANKYLASAVFQDYELWTRLASRYRLANCPRVLVRYRCHPQQNSHTQKTRSHQDMGLYRRRYFFTLFPEAKQEEFECFERLALQKSHLTPADLERAGEWLLRLSNVPDAFLHRQMANRWLAACGRSAKLGLACLEVYCRIAPKLGQADPLSFHKLRLRCLLGLAAGSHAEQFLKNFLARISFAK